MQKFLSKYGKPAIFNTDQGSQFTAERFVSVLLAHGMQPSMDGKGRTIDTILVERLWRSVKYEHIYLKAYEDGWQLEKGMSRYFNFYNQQRMQQSLDYQTPQKVYQQANLLKTLK